MQAAGDLDSYLEEIDRRLRRVQLELVENMDLPPLPPHEEPPPPPREPPSASAEPQATPRSGPRADALSSVPRRRSSEPRPGTRLQAKLLSTMRELLDAFEAALGEQPESPDTVTLSAGPFSSLAAVREFEALLEELPGVREVSIRGYEGDDRAIIEVELSQGPPR